MRSYKTCLKAIKVLSYLTHQKKLIAIEELVLSIYEEGMITVQELETVKEKIRGPDSPITVPSRHFSQNDIKDQERFLVKLDLFYNEFRRKLLPSRLHFFEDICQQVQKIKSFRFPTSILAKSAQLMNLLKTKIEMTLKYVEQNQYTLQKDIQQHMRMNKSSYESQAILILPKDDNNQTREIATSINSINLQKPVSQNVFHALGQTYSTITGHKLRKNRAKPKIGIYKPVWKPIKSKNLQKRQRFLKQLDLRNQQKNRCQQTRSIKKVALLRQNSNPKSISFSLTNSRTSISLSRAKSQKTNVILKQAIKMKQICLNCQQAQPITSHKNIVKSYIMRRSSLNDYKDLVLK